ncbi:MAG TPA: CvpA family protein [Syntrophobacteraceae bacterium]|nr:CvpA family protein [Syntrophobacteraceae bacterium]
MNGLDWVLIVIGAVCLGRGSFRGAISQLFGIAGVIGGLLLAAHSYESVARQLSGVFPGLPGAGAISFFVLFLLTWFCVAVAGYWTGKFFRHSGLGFLDRSLGGLVGMAKALILSVIVIALLTLILSPKSPLLAQSYLAPYAQQTAQLMLKATPKGLQDLFNEKLKTLKRSWIEHGERGEKDTKAKWIESKTKKH